VELMQVDNVSPPEMPGFDRPAKKSPTTVPAALIVTMLSQ
jgi:hypothetical protein